MPNEQISAKNASNGLFDYLIILKTLPQVGFLKFYVMGSTEIHLYGIAHVKVDFIPSTKCYSSSFFYTYIKILSYMCAMCSMNQKQEFLLLHFSIAF